MKDPQDKRLAAMALEHMFTKKRFFSISTIDEVCALLGCPASGPAYDRLRMLHCMHWGDIPKDVMEMIPVWINQLLQGPPVSVVQIPALREGNVHSIGFEDTPLLDGK